MAPKKPLLANKFDGRITELIHNLLHERNLNPNESKTTYATDLRTGEVLAYVQLKDLTLRRTKKTVLETSIFSILQTIRAEEMEEMRQEEDFDKAEFDDEGQKLMSVANTNTANKSVVALWNINKKKEESPTTTDANVEPTEEAKEVVDGETEGSKSKKRSKDNSKPAKRHKEKKDRSPPSFTLSSLGGIGDIISELLETIALPIQHPEIYISTGVEPPRGVLLHGPPGCGKTTIANALAGELGVPFLNISAPSIVSGMSGESEKKVRELFDEAKSLAPCLIFIDEIDAITPKRDGGAQREMERRIVAQLLTSIDDLSMEKTGGKPVIIIGATNRPDSLDPALRRAGRFDREICLNVPNEIQRMHILQTMTKNLKISGELDFKALAKMTPGYVGADLKALTAAAGIAAIKRIFENLSDVPNVDDMEIDNHNQTGTPDGDETTQKLISKYEHDETKLTTIQRFLNKHPNALTPAQLEPLSITNDDFLTALPTIQPTAKREGFATVPDVTWSNVGALSRIRVELNMAVVQPIKRPEIYEQVGITAPGGVLLWGPPGCGKTLLAKAVANESRANFISIKGPELLNKYVGESEKAVRQVFNRARASVPCIIFFDELDSLIPRRDSNLSESSSRVVNTLLTELDGLNDRKGIFVIGATNRPDMIDPAMLRPGRLDKTLYVELPTLEEKVEILKTVIKVNRTPVTSDVNLLVIASDERCKNFSGADISSLVREAGVIALKEKIFTQISVGDETTANEDTLTEIIVTNSHFMKALASVKPSVSDRDRLKYEKLNKRMGWSVISEVNENEQSKGSNNPGDSGDNEPQLA